MGKSFRHITLLIAAVFMTVAGVSDTFAARNGLMGATSTGYVEVSLSIPPRIQINNVKDINLGVYQNQGGLKGHSDLCIYTNGVGGYKVNVLSEDADANDFKLYNRSQKGAVASLPLDVSWNNKKGPNGARKLNYNKAVNFDKMANSGCGANDYNANISVNVREGDLRAAPSGYYTANLAVLVEPN